MRIELYFRLEQIYAINHEGFSPALLTGDPVCPTQTHPAPPRKKKFTCFTSNSSSKTSVQLLHALPATSAPRHSVDKKDSKKDSSFKKTQTLRTVVVLGKKKTSGDLG